MRFSLGMLAAFGLTGDHNTGGLVSQSHSRRRLIDMLTARSGGAIGVDTDVFIFYLNFDMIVDNRINMH